MELAKPTRSSIVLATRLSVISAIARLRPTQLGHRKAAISNTL
jgi:hypothetical protein